MPNLLVPTDQALAVVRRVVESVGSALGRSVGVVDREGSLLACSDGAPAMRGVAQLASRLRRAGGFASRRPVWLPLDPTLAAPATLWAPIRCDGRLLGFLWLAHPEAAPSRQEIERTELAVREIANAVRRARADGDVLMRELLAPDACARQVAARRLVEEHGHLADLGVVALVAADSDGGDLRRPSLAAATHKHPFQLVTEDHIAVIIPGSSANLDAVANGLAARTDAVVGIGQWYPQVRFAYDSYREALGAARAAARLTDLGRVVRWTALGVYRTFAHLPESVLAHSSVHPGLEQLFTEPAHQPLLTTLETYLDVAGNVPLAAQRLYLHRASLYYRLRRVEELLQADLRDGTQRLCLHMAFKLGRFTGRYPARRQSPSGTTPQDRHRKKRLETRTGYILADS